VVAVAAVAVVVPHLVCLWWREWTVVGGVLHCAPMCQQSSCNSSSKLQLALSGMLRSELQNYLYEKNGIRFRSLHLFYRA
jgi:hypothetical protein